MSARGPRAARLALLLLPVLLARTTARAAEAPVPGETGRAGVDPGSAPPLERVAISVVAGAACAPPLHDVVAGQLADLTADLVWTCRDRFDPEEAFRALGPETSAVRVLIDLRLDAEARLALGDARSDRFVVRRVPLANGLDELGREQIGQILRFAVLALRTGQSPTLSRTEARAAVADWTPPRGPSIPPPRAEIAPRSPPSPVAIEATWSLQALSAEIPVVHELALAAAVGRVSSPVSGWVEAGYRLPARYHAEPVGVELSAASLRLGVAVGQDRARLLSFRAGGGIGAERVWFAPIGAATSVDPATADAFWSATARVWIGLVLRASATMAIGARFACDVAGADVHYDLHDSSGAAHRVLTERRVTPGLGLGIAWRP